MLEIIDDLQIHKNNVRYFAMYKCTLYLKNESEWIEYAKNIIEHSNTINDETIETILIFPFEFGSLNSNS